MSKDSLECNVRETTEEIDGLLKPGTMIGEYQISERIGEGAIAEIYRARQLKLDRDVAVKVLNYQDDWDGEIIELFEQEAKTIARLNHPNIVQVIDCGRHDKLYYFVMEYVDGTDFKEILKGDVYDLRQKLDAIIQALRALDYAHNNGIVHRDIKPANLLVSSSGHVKVADFGIALVVDSQKLVDTEPGNLIGTPAYMSPEQWYNGNSLDNRSDVYSVGVMLYEALTSSKPTTDPQPPSSICAEAPPELDGIVLKCLATDPDDRYQSAAELKNELLAAITDAAGWYRSSIGNSLSTDADPCLSDGYAHLDTLHESPFGATYLVKNTKNKTLYVVKKLCRSISGIKEARLLIKLRHPNLIRVYGAGSDSEKGILITEYAQGGSLADRLVRAYPAKEALEIFKQIASGLSYAHKNGIIHGNLRPSNILFDSRNTVKLTDFALPEHYIRRRANWYRAPEREKSILFDVYSTGIILYQLLTTKIPDIRSGGELAWISRSRDGRFSLLNIISQMLERDPARRPRSFEVVLQQINELGRSPSPIRMGSEIEKTTVR